MAFFTFTHSAKSVLWKVLEQTAADIRQIDLMKRFLHGGLFVEINWYARRDRNAQNTTARGSCNRMVATLINLHRLCADCLMPHTSYMIVDQ